MNRDKLKAEVDRLKMLIDDGESIEKCYQQLKTIENCLWTMKAEKFAAVLQAARLGV